MAVSPDFLRGTEVDSRLSAFEIPLTTERILFPDEVDAYNVGEWIPVTERPHEEIISTNPPTLATVIGREVRRIGLDLEGESRFERQKIYVLGDHVNRTIKHPKPGRMFTRTLAENPKSGQTETIIFTSVQVTKLTVIDRP